MLILYFWCDQQNILFSFVCVCVFKYIKQTSYLKLYIIAKALKLKINRYIQNKHNDICDIVKTHLVCANLEEKQLVSKMQQ